MKVLIIYDSVFGNTQQIARAMGNALSPQEDVEILPVGDVKPALLTGSQVLIVGSPTRAFRPTPAIKKLLGGLPRHGLKGVKVAAFDTRMSIDDMDARILRFMARLFGYAAKPIADNLKRKGGELAVPPEGFLVGGTEGPLKEGELARAVDWARQILATA